MRMKTTLAAAVGALCLASPALAQQLSVKFGVLNDRSGLYADITGEGAVLATRTALRVRPPARPGLYADIPGEGSVLATRMAIEDFKAAEKGIKAEVISGDHQ